MTNKQDKSAELKNGMIKVILVQIADEILPDFQFLAHKNGCYTFQRLRRANGWTVYETLHIIFSPKDSNFSCSIASTVNPENISSNDYNTGLINSHKDLKAFRHNSGALSIQHVYYFHNGQAESTTKTVREIFEDFKKYGLSFLDKQLEKLRSNSIIRCGFDYIDGLQTDKETLKRKITEALNKSGLLLSSFKHPIYIAAKEKMQSAGGQSREDRQKIPKIAHEFLKLYCTR